MIPRPPIRRVAALLTAAVLAVSACGGDDEPVAAPTEPSAGEPATTDPTVTDPTGTDPAGTDPAGTEAPVEGPVATVPPDLPDAREGGVGPVDVIGGPLPPLTDEASDPAIGQPAPVLVGLDLDGRPIRIDPAADGPTMLVFVAHWCPHCNDEIPKLNRMRADGRFPADLNIVAVSTAVSPDRPNWPPVDWLRDTMSWEYPAMLDGVDLERETFVAADAYGVTGFPFVVLVDGDGVVADRWSGERDPAEILSRIDAVA